MQALKTVLRLNAASCLGFGLAFILQTDGLAAFLDGVPPAVLRWIGIVLTIHGFHLLLAARKARIGRWEIGYFILGDALWVAGSLLFVTAVPVIQSPGAVAAVLGVAAMVGTFAWLQARFGRNVLGSAGEPR